MKRAFLFMILHLLPMAVVAAAVAGAVYGVEQVVPFSWWWGVVASPVIYFLWLIGYLYVSCRMLRRIGAKHPKPRYNEFRVNEGLSSIAKGLQVATVCYTRRSIIDSLPLAITLSRAPGWRNLVLGAYSPSVHIHETARLWGSIVDPDLTYIEEGAAIGAQSCLVAHADSIRPDGTHVYVSAPIRIGRRTTIGGGVHITLGCVVGDDAVIESGSVLSPFTNVPPGEVWSGNPARFQRVRQDRTEASEPASVLAPITPEVAGLVENALCLHVDLPWEQWTSDRIAAWDSMGQIAIATALFDRHGIAVSAGEVFHLRSLQDVANLVAGQESVPAKKEESNSSLPRDMELLPLLNTREATRALAAQFEGKVEDGQPLRIVVAATFVAQPIAGPLKLWGRAFGFNLDIQFADYGQVVQALLDGNGPFAQNTAGVNVILARAEDFPSGFEQAEQALDAIAAYVSVPSQGRQTLVGTLPPAISAFAEQSRKEVEALRQHWRARLEGISGVELFDFAEAVERLGADLVRSSESEVLTRGPYSPALYQEAAAALVRCIRAKRRSPAKVIVLDCDNTLWGGVLGEVGLDGVEIGPDGAGRAFLLFQHFLKRLKNQGLMLAVASRNEEREVREMFDKHPGMILRTADIAAWKVNWKSKSENLREIATELNLGLDSLVFVDDDPVVRMEVEARAPQVHVVPMPANPSAYCETLGRLWLFDEASTTEVDLKRTEMMQVENQRQRELKSAASLDDYLAGLQLRVEMRTPAETEWARVAQLTQRTNQFNLSLKRRTIEEVVALSGNSDVFIVYASDRFGDYGLVGLAVLKTGKQAAIAEFDTLLMSCRALGRGVEDAFLYGIAHAAAERGATGLAAPFVEGPRNNMIKEFLARTGFHETTANLWELPLDRAPALPPHVQFEDCGRAVAVSSGT